MLPSDHREGRARRMNGLRANRVQVRLKAYRF